MLNLEVALAKAMEFGLDLVEVSPMAKPPVCKIMDYGKFKYETKKKANEAKKKQTVVKLKEVKFRPKTEEHDYNFKVKAVREFLDEGNKARITVMFRGREITHREIGQAILTRIAAELKEMAVVEQSARLEGRLLFMILAPNPRWVQSQEAKKAKEARQGANAASKAAAASLEVPAATDGAPAGDGATSTAAAPASATASTAAAPAATAAAPRAASPRGDGQPVGSSSVPPPAAAAARPAEPSPKA